MGRQDYETETLISHALTGGGFDASEDGTGRGTPIISFQTRGSNIDTGDVPGTIGSNADRASGSAPMIAFQSKQSASAQSPSFDDVSPTLDVAKSGGMAVAVALRGREGGATAELSEIPSALRASQGGGDKPYALTSAVRRLTPRECERLQGFPDDYTLVPYRGKSAADGPRYKALGNSMAVPVMRWLGERIKLVHGQFQ
jgi:site-specific DNA-cytosine methylase